MNYFAINHKRIQTTNSEFPHFMHSEYKATYLLKYLEKFNKKIFLGVMGWILNFNHNIFFSRCDSLCFGNCTWHHITAICDKYMYFMGSHNQIWIAHFMNLIAIFFLGVMAYALAIVLGITSLPSVTNVLTWKEFGFVQSKLGWICLLFACAHDMFYGWPYIGSPSCKVPPTFQVIIFEDNYLYFHIADMYF